MKIYNFCAGSLRLARRGDWSPAVTWAAEMGTCFPRGYNTAAVSPRSFSKLWEHKPFSASCTFPAAAGVLFGFYCSALVRLFAPNAAPLAARPCWWKMTDHLTPGCKWRDYFSGKRGGKCWRERERSQAGNDGWSTKVGGQRVCDEAEMIRAALLLISCWSVTSGLLFTLEDQENPI